MVERREERRDVSNGNVSAILLLTCLGMWEVEVEEVIGRELYP